MEEIHKKVKFVFDVYSNNELLDAADLINSLRALNLNPTMALVTKLGGADKRGEKQMNFDEFLNVFLAAKDNKDEGGFVDFVECLKIYDVGENGHMKLLDLTSMLLTLGEKVSEKELSSVMTDCMLEEEDDEGWIPYLPFLCRLCEKPVPKELKPVV